MISAILAAVLDGWAHPFAIMFIDGIRIRDRSIGLMSYKLLSLCI